MMRGGALLAAALALQAAAFTSLAAYQVPPSRLTEPLLLHAAASFVFALVVRRMHGRRCPRQAGGIALLVGVTNVFLPMIAPIGWLLALRPALRPVVTTAEAARGDVQPVEPEPFQERAVPTPPAQPLGGSHDLWGTLCHAPDARLRVKALLATKALDAPSAGALLRIGLRDGEDEVRLLAFALLTEREFAMQKRIHENKRVVADPAGGGSSYAANKIVAHAYWQLALLAGQGRPAATPLCRRALEYTRQALAGSQADWRLHLFAARLHLELGQAFDAGAHVEEAQRHGSEPEQCAALRAEVAFRSMALRQTVAA